MDHRAHPDPIVLEVYNLDLEARYGLTHGTTTGYAAPFGNLAALETPPGAGAMYALDVSSAQHLASDPTGPKRLPSYFTTLDPANPLYLPWPAGSTHLDWETDTPEWNAPTVV